MLRALVVALLLAVPVSAFAQPPADALRTCLADSTTGKERKALAKWVFLSMAAHPDMKQLGGPNLGPARDESSRAMGAIVMRLFVESCVNEIKAALKTGQGAQSIELAFQGLGGLAMQELMADTSVQEAMSQFRSHIDQERLAQAFAAK